MAQRRVNKMTETNLAPIDPDDLSRSYLATAPEVDEQDRLPEHEAASGIPDEFEGSKHAS